MSTIPLATTVSATFNANGVASVFIGPQRYGQEWTITSIVISSTSTLATTCTAYKNWTTANNQVDFTHSGNNDTSDTSLDLLNLDTLILVWNGGTPGATATAVIYGTIDTGRND